MEPEEAVERVRALLEPLPRGLRVGLDDWGHVCVFVRQDMLHLDADALNDRLHAWVVREVGDALPTAEGLVSFRHAHPASDDEAELDIQAGWRDLEPMFRIDPRAACDEEALRLFAKHVPGFLAAVHGEGRPEGWRDVEMGNAE